MKFRDRVRVRDASSAQEYWAVKHTVLYRGLPSVLPTITSTLHLQRHNPRPQGHQCDKLQRPRLRHQRGVYTFPRPGASRVYSFIAQDGPAGRCLLSHLPE